MEFPKYRNVIPHGAMPKSVERRSGDGVLPMICRAVFEEMFILANGDIVCASPDPTGRRIYGNVHRDRIADVFDGPMYREMRQWQLASEPSTSCPVTSGPCARRVARPTRLDRQGEVSIRVLELEPVSACNVRCPGCPVTDHFPSPELIDRAKQVMPLATMNDIIQQLPHLRTLLLYGFGEPFLHKDLIEFLRETKRTRPDIVIAISTNGIPLNETKIGDIARENLVDKMVFAIDGVDQESYGRYRVGGKVDRALGNLRDFAKAVNVHGSTAETVWQYILFEWNDSDDEIKRAKSIAAELGVKLDWLPTHSPGASKRYAVNSDAFNQLREGVWADNGGSKEIKMTNLLLNNGIPENIYLAEVNAAVDGVRIETGGRLSFDVSTKNASGSDWADGGRTINAGGQLQTLSGRKITDIWRGYLSQAGKAPGATEILRFEADIAAPPGEYRLLIDMVEEGRCWFHQWGSAPFICSLVILP
jgi:pyruvate-formate lyase-activating enzyme